MVVDALNELRASLNVKRQNLIAMEKEFGLLADTESDDFKRMSKDNFKKYALILRDYLGMIETLFIATAGAKNQIQGIQDVILKLPEIKSNDNLRHEIEQAFRNSASNI